MQITEIIEIIKNRLSSLNNGRIQAVAVGDLAAVVQFDAQIQEIKISLEKLEALIKNS